VAPFLLDDLLRFNFSFAFAARFGGMVPASTSSVPGLSTLVSGSQNPYDLQRGRGACIVSRCGTIALWAAQSSKRRKFAWLHLLGRSELQKGNSCWSKHPLLVETLATYEDSKEDESQHELWAGTVWLRNTASGIHISLEHASTLMLIASHPVRQSCGPTLDAVVDKHCFGIDHRDRFRVCRQ